jgi:NADPH-dependent 2,4-dienoyl-CoA reductase/sulfur reductase-like enzyme
MVGIIAVRQITLSRESGRMEHLESEFCVVGAGYAGLAAARSLLKP